jgi:hypothetical protein
VRFLPGLSAVVLIFSSASRADGAPPPPSVRARRIGNLCKGIDQHFPPLREFDGRIFSYALRTFGDPRACRVHWSEQELT